MKDSRAKQHSHHEEYGNARVQGNVDDAEQLGLADGAEGSEAIPDEIELRNLLRVSTAINIQRVHTLVGKGSSRRKLPNTACRATYVQLRMAYSGEYSQVCKP